MPDSKPLTWPFWVLWVIASALSAAVVALVARSAAYATGYAVGGAGGAILGEAALGAVALGGFLGTMGLAQWLVMMREVDWAGRWLLANAVSGAAAGAVMLGLYAALSPIVGVVAGLAAFGGVLWVVLRPRVSGAGLLATAGVLGLVAAAVGAGLLGALQLEAAAGGGFGIGYGAVTGGALLILSRRSASAGAASGAA